MYCPKCGTEIADDSTFCSKCGIKINNTQIKNNENEVSQVTEDIKDYQYTKGKQSRNFLIGGIILLIIAFK